MKKTSLSFLITTLISSTALFAQSTDPAPYCNAGYSDFGGMAIHYISNVTLGTLNNTSGTTS